MEHRSFTEPSICKYRRYTTTYFHVLQQQYMFFEVKEFLKDRVSAQVAETLPGLKRR